MEEKSEVIYYKDIAFRRYPNSSKWADRNYYVPNATHRKRGIGRLHQEIWKDAHGLIPEGYHIHHKDENPLNNSLENRSEEHTSELQSHSDLVCRLLLEQ